MKTSSNEHRHAAIVDQRVTSIVFLICAYCIVCAITGRKMSSNPLYLIPAHTDIEAIKQRYGRCIADKKKARKKALLTYSGRGRLSILQIYNDDIDELYNEQNRTVKSARESNAAEKTTTQQNYFLLLTMAIVILSMPIITTNWWNE